MIIVANIMVTETKLIYTSCTTIVRVSAFTFHVKCTLYIHVYISYVPIDSSIQMKVYHNKWILVLCSVNGISQSGGK